MCGSPLNSQSTAEPWSEPLISVSPSRDAKEELAITEPVGLDQREDKENIQEMLHS